MPDVVKFGGTNTIKQKEGTRTFFVTYLYRGSKEDKPVIEAMGFGNCNYELVGKLDRAAVLDLQRQLEKANKCENVVIVSIIELE